MATFHFDLVSPEKLAFSGEVDQVDIPGWEGDFGVLAGHAPVVAAVRPGILTIIAGGEKQKIIVLGGLAEVSDNRLTVLADVATSIDEVDRASSPILIARDGRSAEKEGGELDHAIERLDHFKSIQQQLTPRLCIKPRAPLRGSSQEIPEQIQRSSRTWRALNLLHRVADSGILPRNLLPGLVQMKRKIAAIFAADIAGYQGWSRRRGGDAAAPRVLSRSHRRFHRKGGGRIFNTAGDAVLAEFSERGGCGALRDRHPGKPADPQHGLSAEPADVVPHRHHHRRRGRAQRRSAGRRRQHRRAAGRPRRGRRHLRLARGARAGRQQAVGAVRRYRRAGGQEHPDPGARLHGGDAARGRHLTPAAAEEARSKLAAAPVWMWPLVVAIVSLVAIGVTGFLYNTKLKQTATARQ
jgi:F-type H+-transporting ATPase subunit epsilon